MSEHLLTQDDDDFVSVQESNQTPDVVGQVDSTESPEQEVVSTGFEDAKKVEIEPLKPQTQASPDLLLDFGGGETDYQNEVENNGYTLVTEKKIDLEPLVPEKASPEDFDRTPVAEPNDRMFGGNREATPPPSSAQEKEGESEKSRAEIKPEPVKTPNVKPSAPPSADSTTPSSDDRPVKMPKATMSAIGRGSSGRVGCSGGSWVRRIPNKVWDVLLWRDPRVTGPLLAAILMILLSLTCCSVFSVTSYTLLMTVVGAFATRLVKFVIARVHSGDETHPFKDALDTDVSVDEHHAVEYAQTTVQYFNSSVSLMKDLLLVRDILASMKFGLVLYAMTYVGAWFNGLTVLILVVVGLFTIPKIYEVNKTKIDHYVHLAQSKFDEAYAKLQGMVKPKQKTQ